MARTIADIYDAIIAEKEEQTELAGLLPDPDTAATLLADLTSNSKAAVWRLWAWITAVAIHVHEVAWDIFKTEVEAIAAAAPAGTAQWYRAQMLKFQFGYALVYANFQYNYATIDTDAQIITRCAIEERSDGALIVKVAKGTTTLSPLSAPEKSAAESYANKIKFAGTRLAVTSLNPDVITPLYDVYYDPIIPIADLVPALQSAVDAYFSTLPFNGEYRVTKFTDVLQAVTGVVDPVETNTKVLPDGGSYITINVRYVPAAGYFTMSDTVDNLFNFIPFIG
jgi:hypothetical protein